MMRPYYEADGVTLYHGDCCDMLSSLAVRAVEAALVWDPPYGIDYRSNKRRRAGSPRDCANDGDTSVRDAVLAWWHAAPGARSLTFGSWKRPKPIGTAMTIYWDTGGALGMGDLSLPWRNSSQEIYAIGRRFVGRRQGNVLRFPPVQSIGRRHPFEKPVDLMQALIGFCPDATIVDLAAGSGATLVAAKNLGRRAIGCEIDERHCETIARRLSQGVLALGGAA
jgi:hypothetical protein